MKRVFFLLIGILIVAVACQDDFVEPENSLTTKSAKYEKIKTFQVKGWTQIIPDETAPRFQCMPVEAGVDMCSYGWLTGHMNISGKIIQEESTYTKLYCELILTPEGPVIYNEVSADVKFACGESVSALAFVSINTVTGEVTGHTDYVAGTGRFEGITGSTKVVNGKVLPDGGLFWDTEGSITLVLKD
ncbi:hypothetical protein [Maribellus sediminis]|uniref:hypothetical protein n=1 Tax=Maribellus sediminis TaxID=2696285 RepID=UPI001430136B|nr:hypothetical protein [Maribellus sediminis]